MGHLTRQEGDFRPDQRRSTASTTLRATRHEQPPPNINPKVLPVVVLQSSGRAEWALVAAGIATLLFMMVCVIFAARSSALANRSVGASSSANLARQKTGESTIEIASLARVALDREITAPVTLPPRTDSPKTDSEPIAAAKTTPELAAARILPAPALTKSPEKQASPTLVETPPATPPRPFLLPDHAWFAIANKEQSDQPSATETTEPVVCAKDRSLGTSIKWACSTDAAFAQAKAEHKLVFLIEVSGNFERPGFT